MQLELTLTEQERLASALPEPIELQRTSSEAEVNAAERAANSLLLAKLCRVGASIHLSHRDRYDAAEGVWRCVRCRAVSLAFKLRSGG